MPGPCVEGMKATIMTTSTYDNIEAIHEEKDLILDEKPSALSSFFAWTGLTLATITVCGLMGGLWMFMLGIQI